jgi:hypothetical protein
MLPAAAIPLPQPTSARATFGRLARPHPCALAVTLRHSAAHVTRASPAPVQVQVIERLRAFARVIPKIEQNPVALWSA